MKLPMVMSMVSMAPITKILGGEKGLDFLSFFIPPFQRVIEVPCLLPN